MKNRSRTEIVSSILDAANGGATKTKIMYKAFLSYNQLKEYLSVLIENNLIEYLEGNKTFKTTEKGLNLLKMHNEMARIIIYYTQKRLVNFIFFVILKHLYAN
jgi:predicted transcriptional regulator